HRPGRDLAITFANYECMESVLLGATLYLSCEQPNVLSRGFGWTKRTRRGLKMKVKIPKS
ncbi:hypothetical protein VP01_11610g1, partial [Puccinia sorghi]